MCVCVRACKSKGERHTLFMFASDGRGRAFVHCVILPRKREREKKKDQNSRTSKLSTLLVNINTLSIAVAFHRVPIVFSFAPRCSLFHFRLAVIGESRSSSSSSSSFSFIDISASGDRFPPLLFVENSSLDFTKETDFFFGATILTATVVPPPPPPRVFLIVFFSSTRAEM